jgi:hypothetical protein
MAVQAVNQREQIGHLVGDVPALFIVAIALSILMPRSQSAATPQTHDQADRRFGSTISVLLPTCKEGEHVL